MKAPPACLLTLLSCVPSIFSIAPYNLNISRSTQSDGAQRQQTSSKKRCDAQSSSLYLYQTPKYKQENHLQFPPKMRIQLITQKRTTDKNLHLLPPRGSHPRLKTQKNKISEKDSLKRHFLFLFLVHLCFRFLTMVAGCAEQQTPGGKSTDVGGGECPCYTG